MSEKVNSHRLGDATLNLGGDMEDSLIVGHGNQLHTYTYNVDHGGVLNVAASPIVHPRPTPLKLGPKPFANFLDRQAIVAKVRTALVQSQPVEIYAGPGVGKTSLMRYLAHQPEMVDGFVDGVVYLSAVRQPAADLLQVLYDVFYETTPVFKPSYGQIQHSLSDKQALIILYGLSLDKPAMEWLMAALPQCTFVLGSETRVYWQEGAAIALPGLPLLEAIALIQQDLGRNLLDSEQAAAQSLWSALSGNPLQLRRAVAQAKTQAVPLDTWLASVQSVQRQAVASASGVAPSDLKKASLNQSVLTTAMEQLSVTHKKLLALLGAMGGVALSAQQCQAISQVPQAVDTLNELARLQLVEVTRAGYQLCADLDDGGTQRFDPQPWLQCATDYFTQDAVGANPDAMLHLLTWTQTTGQWQQSLSLVRDLDAALSLGGRWQQWRQVLTHSLQAAQQLGDGRAEAWSLHQLGTRAIAVGNPIQATHWLSRAVDLREALGDRVGAAISRHNLALIVPPVDLGPGAQVATATTASAGGVDPVTDLGASKLVGFAVAAAVAVLFLSGMGIALWVGQQSSPVDQGETVESDPTEDLDRTEDQADETLTTLDFDVTSLAFGGVSVGQRRQEALTITNSGKAPLVIQSLTVEGEDDFELSEQTCTAEPISPARSCSVAVLFAPERMGDRTAQLVVASNASNPGTLTLSGTGMTSNRESVPTPGATTRSSSASAPIEKPSVIEDSTAPSQPEETLQSGDDSDLLEDPPFTDGEAAPLQVPSETPGSTPPSENQPPALQPIDLLLRQGEPYTFDLLVASQAVDPDGGTVELAGLGTLDAGSELINNGDGTVTYYPSAGPGSASPGSAGASQYSNSFEYTVVDSDGAETVGIVSITVTVAPSSP